MNADERLALAERQEAGERLKFVFFWSHESPLTLGLGPWILSQWYPASLVVDGLRYPTAEHWMMAEKARLFGDDEALERVMAAAHPGEAKAIGGEVRWFEQGIWDEHREGIVEAGNAHKFKQNPELAEWLGRTGDRVLVEASPRDRIWSCGLSERDPNIESVAAWPGLNLMGFALMRVRARMEAGLV